MAYSWRWLRSLVFSIQIYAMMALMAVFFTPWALFDRRGAFAAVHTWCRYVRWSAAVIAGLHSEIRGEVPQGGVLIAAKHQSFLDIIMIFGALPRPRFIMKKQLVYAPILGWYALRVGCVPVDRGKRGQAIKQMTARVKAGTEAVGQLIIYPQGTRVAPGVKMPYKIGTAVLYQELAQDCVPVATNVGMFWPRHSLFRKPGLAVVEFLPPIPAGMPMREFLNELEQVVETTSDTLADEAREQLRPRA